MDLLFEPFDTSESENARSDACGSGTSQPFASTTYTASSCPRKLCPECCEFQANDIQTIDSPNLLFRKQNELKTKINQRYDQLTSRLPLELISYIFALIVGETHENRWYDEGEWNPAVMLGAVCRRWKEITLGTPQLWTKFLITAQNLKYASFSNIITERLSRSRSLPLSLVVIGDDTQISFPVLSYLNIVAILRSEVHRWKDLEIEGTMAIFHALLTGLEDKVAVDSLLIHMSDPDPDAIDKITMEHTLTPKRLDIENVSLPQFPIQWGALAQLSAYLISVDGLLHVFRHAQNLQYCRLYTIAEDAGYYLLPTSPITNVSIKQLQTHGHGVESDIGVILLHLALPSLSTFDHTIDNDDPYCIEEMEILAGFLDRSQAPLHNLSLYIDTDWELSMDWYLILPYITCLELRVREYSDNGERMQAHLERLRPHAEPTALPRLRELKFHANIMSPHSWTALAEMFPDHENENDRTRPLNSVKIYLDRPSDFDRGNMPEGTFSRLCAIRKSGVKIQVFGEFHDENEILEPWDLGSMGPDALFSTYCLLSDDE